ncbi:MAG: FKBP-type peptidyl-prolyl cis-trans isomerase [Sphingobacteriia bacterium]
MLVCALGCKPDTQSADAETVALPGPDAKSQAGDSTGRPPYAIADSSQIVTTASGLQYYVVSKGAGNIPKPGYSILAHYHGMLADGSVFDSSFDRGQPFNFTLGQGQVIKGWDEAFGLLPVGTRAILIIPAGLAYGDQDRPNIPGGSTLYFHVQLLAANPS